MSYHIQYRIIYHTISYISYHIIITNHITSCIILYHIYHILSYQIKLHHISYRIIYIISHHIIYRIIYHNNNIYHIIYHIISYHIISHLVSYHIYTTAVIWNECCASNFANFTNIIFWSQRPLSIA